MPNGTVHSSGCTNPIQATPRLVIVLVSNIQKSGTGDNNLQNGKGILVRQTEMTGSVKWTTLKGGLKCSGRTEPKWSVPFDF